MYSLQTRADKRRNSHYFLLTIQTTWKATQISESHLILTTERTVIIDNFTMLKQLRIQMESRLDLIFMEYLTSNSILHELFFKILRERACHI